MYVTSQDVKKAKAAIRLISRQVKDTHENRLMFAVFAQAVLDAVSTDPRADAEGAAIYMEGNMAHLEHLGINQEWARSKLIQAGVRLGSYNATEEGGEA